jgi:PAS domain S-box-containing protein
VPANRDKELREALHLAGFGVWRLDLVTRRIEWDEQMRALFGLPTGTAINPEKLFELIHPEDRGRVRSILTAPLAERPRLLDHRIILPNGGVRWLSATISFMNDDRGEPTILTGIAWDTTERHEMLESLRATESYRRQAHRIAHLTTWSWEPGASLPWTREIRELYGVPPDSDLSAEEHDRLIHPDDRERVLQEFMDSMRSNVKEARQQYRVIQPGGDVRHFRSSRHLERDARGRVCRVTGVLQDITDHVRAAEERARLESELHQAQRLDALGTLAGGIAHDFNNILLAIGGNAQLALADCPVESPMRTSLLEIEKARARASDLVRRMLTFSRPASPDPREIDLAPVVSEALKLLRAAVPATIELRAQLRTPIPRVIADAGQMYQVVMNLVTNAAQAIGERGGVVDVVLEETALCEAPQALSLQAPGPYLRLTVSDDGPGMDENTKAHMFEPFFTTKGPGRGTGLGLAIVHGIVKGHGGAVAVTSAPGEGSRIDVYLPVSHAGAAVEPSSEQASSLA